ENKVYVILGDGECNEGSIWEGAMAASKFKLQNLRVIIDKNNYQQTGSTEEIMPNKNLANKFDQFGWNVNEVDGHNIKDLHSAIIEKKFNEKPTVIVANTIKGKGVDFFENDNKWHHNLLTKADYENAKKEVLK
ncbi:transketolase, partial [Alphaproteobacteria bacterium]|nr:transketolase [Alphaproteobacteria bacterium]